MTISIAGRSITVQSLREIPVVLEWLIAMVALCAINTLIRWVKKGE